MHSQETLTILSFCFGRRSDVAAQVGLIKTKFAKKAWIIIQLKLQGVANKTLAQVFASVVRSMIEYASPSYHPMLSVHLEEQIENLQRMSLKTIYGRDVSYTKALEKFGLESLKIEENCILKKLQQNPPSTKESKKSGFPRRPENLTPFEEPSCTNKKKRERTN